jgi:hypothetical protein
MRRVPVCIPCVPITTGTIHIEMASLRTNQHSMRGPVGCWYSRYSLSYRDIEEHLIEPGLGSTIRRFRLGTRLRTEGLQKVDRN